MKILLVHNYYGSSAPSGENRVVEAEKCLLLRKGHEVLEFSRHSDELRSTGLMGMIKGALATPYNPFIVRAIQKDIADFKPDVVHVHNTFPLISPSIFSAIGNRAARILTLHNYRIFCPAASLMRAGMVCTSCVDLHSTWPSIVHGCYRNSRMATLPIAANVSLHRALGTWQREVDTFITLSDFQRTIMNQAGLPLDKLHVNPNYFAGNPQVIPWHERGNYAVFAGRLTKEKGIQSLVNAWIAWGVNAPELRIVGDGPLRISLQNAASGSAIKFLGHLSYDETVKQISNAQLLMLPSECIETFGLTLVEAFASGTPAAVSNVGPLPSIINDGINGIVFEPANPQSLLSTVYNAWQTQGYLEHRGVAARNSFDTLYTEEIHYSKLLDIYNSTIYKQR